MHILFLSDNFSPETNAPATRLHEHARKWVRLGAEVTVVTCAPNFPEGRLLAGYRNRWCQRETLDGIEVLRVKTYIAPNRGFIRRTVDYLSFIPGAVAAGSLLRRPDIVVATSPQFFAAVAGWLVAAIRRVPFVFELRDLWPSSIVAVGAMRKGLAIRCIEKLELLLYRRAALVVALTEAFAKDLIARGIDARKIVVIQNGVDLSRYTPRPRDEKLARSLGLSDRFVVGYLGTHGLSHALEHVLEAAEILRGNDGVRFLFAGSGAERESLVASAHRRGLSNVVFHPPVEKERILSLWSLCDVALVHLKNAPVFATVLPSKIFEALAMGVPILLCAPDGEAATLLRSTCAGVVLPPENPSKLAAELVRLSCSPDLVRVLSASALEAAPRFDREHLATRMLAALEETTRRSGRLPAAARPEGA